MAESDPILSAQEFEKKDPVIVEVKGELDVDTVPEEEEFTIVQKQSGHCFYLTSFTSPTYCNVCSDFIWGIRKQGLTCDCCGYVSHQQCKDKVDNPCYSARFLPDEENPNSVQFEHFWIAGNTHAKRCCFCSQKTKASKGGFSQTRRCSKCNSCAHTKCVEENLDSARFCKPPFVNMMFCEDLLHLDFPPEDYKPLLVFVNHKSGGQQGLSVLKQLRGFLTQEQVISLLDETPVGPGNALTKYGLLAQMHILVCGGDGTAGWVLQEMMDKRDDFREREWIPPMSVLPLGTGNDLARVLNWGGGYTSSSRLDKILMKIMNHSEKTMLDRWEVKITPNDESAHSREPETFVLNNYFSVGLDAQIALQFHNMREANPGLFKSRTVNKGIYGVYGVQKIIAAPPKISEFGVKVLVNEEAELPPEVLKKLECIVWQNIPSYGGGSVLWGDYNPELEPNIQPCKMDDGVLEVVGLKNITHVVGIQTSVSSGTKLGQGSKFQIEITKECPIQIDGEPLVIGPSIIEIRHMNTATMLSKKKKVSQIRKTIL